MKTTLHRLKLLSAILCVALAACGGGGDDNGAGGGASGGTGNSGNTSGTGGSDGTGGTGGTGGTDGAGGTGGNTATRTVMFEDMPASGTSAEFATQLNGQGARGFRFVSGLYFLQNPAGSEQKGLYVKDVQTTYTYELPQEPGGADVQAWISAYEAWLNSHGARGFIWNGPYMLGGQTHVLMRKDNGSPSTFTYKVVLLDLNASLSTFVQNQANPLGADGYYLAVTAYQGPFGASSTVAIFRKDLQGGARYGYEVLPNPATDGDFMAQINTQGARGYRFKAPEISGGTQVNLYEKDLSQSSTFRFYDLDWQQTSAGFLAQANAEGQKGSGLMGSYVLPGGAVRELYFAPASCTGFLCDTRNPFGF